LKFLEIGGTDTIGILKKEFPYLFQHFTKIQRSFSKIERFSRRISGGYMPLMAEFSLFCLFFGDGKSTISGQTALI
jgi:hypothetical protein